MSIPDSIKNLFQRRTVGRLCPTGPITVSGSFETALDGIQPGEILEVRARTTGRLYSVVLRADLDHVLERAGMQAKK